MFKDSSLCMFWWHSPKTLPSGDQSFRALVRERAGWERAEWGIGNQIKLFGQWLFYFRGRSDFDYRLSEFTARVLDQFLVSPKLDEFFPEVFFDGGFYLFSFFS